MRTSKRMKGMLTSCCAIKSLDTVPSLQACRMLSLCTMGQSLDGLQSVQRPEWMAGYTLGVPADLLLGFLALLASAASSASAIFFASSFFAAASARCFSCAHLQSTHCLLSPSPRVHLGVRAIGIVDR